MGVRGRKKNKHVKGFLAKQSFCYVVMTGLMSLLTNYYVY